MLAQFFFFFFNDTATTEIYTLSLHDALPICPSLDLPSPGPDRSHAARTCSVHGCSGCRESHCNHRTPEAVNGRSEEHTSELQSQSNLVCRLLLEKKKKR